MKICQLVKKSWVPYDPGPL